MNPIIYYDDNIIVINTSCLISDEQLQNRLLILIDNKFNIYQYNKISNSFVLITDNNLLNYIIDKLFTIITQENQIQNSTQLYLLYYDAQNNRIINCRTNEIFNVTEFNNLAGIYNYINQRNQQLQLNQMNQKQPELLQAMNQNIIYEDENVIISNEVKIETQKQNWILHDYILYSLNTQTNQYDIITDDNIKLRYIPQIIEFVKGNIKTKTIKEQIQNLMNNTNKIIIHIDGKGKYTDLRKNVEIDKKSEKYKYLQSIFKCINNGTVNKTSESSSTQTFHNMITNIANSASNNVELYKQIVLTIFLGLSNDDVKQRIFNSKDKDEIYNILNEMIIKENNQEIYNSTIIKNAQCSEVDLLDIFKYADKAINEDKMFMSKLFDQAYKYAAGKNNDKNSEWTPDCVADLMARLLVKEINDSSDTSENSSQNLNVLDCACGCNNLFRAFERNLKSGNVKYYGCEIAPSAAKMAQIEAKMTGLNADIFCCDFFDFYNGNQNALFDAVICNPPYSKDISKYSVISFLIYSMMISKLGCFIFPTKYLKTNEYLELMKFCTVHKIVRLQFNVFQGVSINDFVIMLVSNNKYINNEDFGGEITVFDITGTRNDYMKKQVRGGKNDVSLTQLGIETYEKILNYSENENDSLIENETEQTEDGENEEVERRTELKIYSLPHGELLLFEPPDVYTSIIQNYVRKYRGIMKMDKSKLLRKFIMNKIESAKELIKERNTKEGQIKILKLMIEYQYLIRYNTLTDDYDTNDDDFMKMWKECHDKINEFDNYKEFETIRLADYFEIVSGPKHQSNEQIEYGDYPFISGSIYNNGCVKYVGIYDYENLYTMSKDCGGYIFYHPYKFCASTHCMILRNIKPIDFDIDFINMQLSSQFEWKNAINKDKFNNINVYIYRK